MQGSRAEFGGRVRTVVPMARWVATAGGVAASTSHHHGSIWEHAPELIVVGVGFVAFLAYLRQERAYQQSVQRRREAPDGWRWLTASLLVIAGLGHVPLIEQHLSEAPYMGALFIVFVLCACALAVAVLRRGTAVDYSAAGMLCLLAVAAYVTTRLVALPELSDDVGAWLEPLGVMCVGTELCVVAVAAVQVRRLSGSSAYVGRHAA